MEIDYIILDSNSSTELELQLDERALDGYKAVSMNQCYDPIKGTMVYSVLMVNYGLNNQLEDVVAQIAEKLDSINTTLAFIETSIGDSIT